jgi:serine carboxypeptidase-like clade II
MSVTPTYYSGHYVPQLARKIVEFNKASPYPFINLKGILVSTVGQASANSETQVTMLSPVLRWATQSLTTTTTTSARSPTGGHTP